MCRGGYSSLEGTSIVICLRGECVWLGRLTVSIPFQIRIFIFAFSPGHGTDAVLVYPMLLSRIGRQWLFLGMHMSDTHLLHCFQPGSLIGKDVLLVRKSAHTLSRSKSCCEAVLKHVVCFNNG